MVNKMVYCTECGFKNLDDAKYCTKCGAVLHVYREERWEKRLEEWGEGFGKRVEKECFGLRRGGIIVGLFMGIFIIIVGISILVGASIFRWIWSFFIIMIGLLITIGALRILQK